VALPIDPSLLSWLIIIVGLAIVIFIIWKLGKLIFGLISNTILGLLTLFLLNTFLGLGVPYDIPVVVVTALFGMVGIAVIVVLKLLGVTA
jgi:hypothetical protein